MNEWCGWFAVKSLHCAAIQKRLIKAVKMPWVNNIKKQKRKVRPVCEPSLKVLLAWLNIWHNGGSRNCDPGLFLAMPLRKHARTSHTLIVKRLWPFLMASTSYFFPHVASILRASCSGVERRLHSCLLTDGILIDTHGQRWDSSLIEWVLASNVFSWMFSIKGEPRAVVCSKAS